MGYFTPPCALDKIVNATIATCNSLDGPTDGVISLTDFCQFDFNLSSLIGKACYCAAESSSSLGFGFSKRQMGGGGAASSQSPIKPEQNGTITTEDIVFAHAVYDGLHLSEGKRAYLSWQIGSDLGDADSIYDNATSFSKLSIPQLEESR